MIKRSTFTSAAVECRFSAESSEMNLVEDIEVICPYCGSSFTIEADTEEGSYATIEDCSVCCRPVSVSIRCRPGKVEAVEAEPG
jgi:Cysteine-rich CPXCG